MSKREGRGKTRHKTLRISAFTAFVVEVCASLEEKSETGVIESAIEEHAAAVSKRHGLKLRDLFHIHPGVAKLNLYLLREFPFADDDEERRNFVMEHRPFFYREEKGALSPHVPFVETLWHKKTGIDAFTALGGKSHWDAGRAMADALRKRGLEPPAWPPKGK
jgi:hypothetical protein